MPQIELTGLQSGLPIGFMAALGVFRHALCMEDLGTVKLGWSSHGNGWCALLQTEKILDEDVLASLLLSRVKSVQSRPELAWSEAIKKTKPETFRERSQAALDQGTDEGVSEWFQAFGTELVCDNEGSVEPTPFDMTVARQRFLADALSLTRELATPDKKGGEALNSASFREALFGPWKYTDDQHSLGWDPGTLLMGAFTPKAPTAMKKLGVRAAVWLAMESLPFFRCMYDGRLATTSFKRVGRREIFRWPIWEVPSSASTGGVKHFV